MRKQVNIHADSKDWRARTISMTLNASFEMEGRYFFSVEGFIQGIKFPPGTKSREDAIRALSVTARKIGARAKRKWIWWKGKQVRYGSKKHKEYIERAIRCRLRKDAHAQAALAACANVTIVCKPPRGERPISIRSAHFCAILRKLRAEFIATGIIKPR